MMPCAPKKWFSEIQNMELSFLGCFPWEPSHHAVKSPRRGEATGDHYSPWCQLSPAHMPGMDPPHDSSPQPFQPPSAVWVFPAQVPDTKEQRSHPVWNSDHIISEHSKTVAASSLKTWCDLYSNRWPGEIHQKTFQSSWANSIKMLGSALSQKSSKCKFLTL